MRLANVLGWKREDGSKIPETAKGLAEHKALVVKYELETGGPIRRSYWTVINRKYVSVAKKIAEGEVARQQSKARADIEKGRAAYAKRLHKWLDTNGSKISSTPGGIRRHKELGSRYEELYGPSSVLDREARARMYKAILDGIEAEKVRRKDQAKRSKVVAAEQAEADAKRDARNRAARNRKRDEREKDREDEDLKIRQRTVRRYQSRIRLAKRRIAASEKDVMGAEELESYRESSAYRYVVKANERAKQLLVIFRKTLAVYESKLAALQD